MRAHRVDAAQETPHPLECCTVFQLRRTAAAFGINGKAKSRERVQRRTVGGERGDDRNLARRELGDEDVLFANLLVGPASGPIEFGDDGGRFIAPDLIDAILIAGERQEPSVTSISDALERIEDDVGRKLGIRMRWWRR